MSSGPQASGSNVERENEGLQYSTINLYEQNLLFSPWMMIAFEGGLDICPVKSAWNKKASVARFTVDVDFNTYSPPLEMAWDQFIWFLLCLGVKFHSLFDIKDDCVVLLDHENELQTNRIIMSKVKHGWCECLSPDSWAFDLRVALSTFHIMLLEENGAMHIRKLVNDRLEVRTLNR